MNAQKRKVGRVTPCAPPKDDPAELPYPGFAREKAALDQKVAAANHARGNPLPGPLREAFSGDPPVCHGFTLLPVATGLQAILQRTKSPVLDVARIIQEELHREDGADVSTPELLTKARAARMAKAQKRLNRIKATQEELVESIFCFIQPQEYLRELLDRGRSGFREAAMRKIGDKLHPLVVVELFQAVLAHYFASFVTVVEYAAPAGKDDGTVFYPPPAGATTASAGGSPSSAP